ncbi:MAG: DUF262 domain-containing protein [Victivallales bacterium]|nr:DUF262 domain-containing protein [Victivallales bacterium]
MNIEATIKSTREILERNLRIPTYQRPYRWTTTNVLQLLNDIMVSMEAGKLEYRIGTAILFYSKDDNTMEIVDGQQRLTTILLILRTVKGSNKDLPGQEIRYQSNSVDAIRENYQFIDKWLSDNTVDRGKALADYILDKCKFAEIVVYDLSEAFQMFDTQNGRGKALELYNLLKAYHIRAMEQNTQDERINCDRTWESATQYDATPDIPNDPNVDILKQLFQEQLFKSRIWCRNEEARSFEKDDIGEFKGFTIDKNHPIEFPFQNPFLLQYLTEKFYNNVLAGTIGTKPRFESSETEKVNPFVSINQLIINGKSFFEYIETYVELYKKMFIELGGYQLAEFKRFFYLYCLKYDSDNQKSWEDARRRTTSFRDSCEKSRRDGDSYLREAYKSLCFVLLDKFGEKVFIKYYKVLYRLIYCVRIQHYAVKLSTAMAAPKCFFSIIHRAKNSVDLIELDKKANALKEEKYGYSDKLSTNLSNFIKEGK